MSVEDKNIPESFLDLPDDELMNFNPDDLPQVSVPREEDPPNEEAAVVTTGLIEDQVTTATTEVSSTEETPTEKVDTTVETTVKGDSTVEQISTETSNETKPTTEQKPTESASIDYKAEYERLLAPFKANGRDISVKGVDDAITLMQMGANYNKKMAALKPNLTLLKMLENNGLLTEEKISFLIDLEKKNPDAINKLIKDSGIDPLDIDADKASGYTPNTYKIDDREIELDTVLDEIQETPTYNRTLEIVSKEWDEKSKQAVANAPQLLKVINSHVQSGIYDLISKEVDSERLFGRLNGFSDIEAYRQVGDMIQARGGFDHLGRQGQQTQAKPIVIQPKPKNSDDEKIKEKKRAASSTKPVATSTVPKDFNPLALSDDEFNKLIKSKYL